jgi:hypothetical protein
MGTLDSAETLLNFVVTKCFGGFSIFSILKTGVYGSFGGEVRHTAAYALHCC